MNITRRLITILTLALTATAVCFASYKVDEIPNVHIADRTRYVTNPDGILSQQAQTMADSIISSIWKSSAAEVVAVVINDFDGNDIDSFATELYSKWGIGKSDKSNGVLVLVAKDRRKAVIRTGYGVEGVLPDIVAGRIIRQQMGPRFKADDYDGGVIAALTTIAGILTDPDAIDEIKSKHQNDKIAADEAVDFFYGYLALAGIFTFGLFCLYIRAISSKRLTDFERYNRLESLKLPSLVVTFFGLGIPVIVYLLVITSMKRLRSKPHACANCGADMHKLDEAADNAYLTPAQDMEENLNSVDYDVWVCPQCNATDIYPYVNKSKSYTVCERCGARTCTLESDRTLLAPTDSREGRGVKTYRCLNCHNRKETIYKIAKTASAAPIIVGGIGGSGQGGGGFSGGSFGGGFTGGGGASGGW